MMVSPKAAKEAGDKFGLKPVCAGPYKFVERVQQDRIVFEKFADYWNKDNVSIDRIVYLPIVDATVRLANLKSGGLDLIERVLATDIKDVRADREAQAVDRARARLSGHRRSTSTRTRPRVRSASRPRCARRSTSRSIATRSIRSCSTANSCPATSGSIPSIPITSRLPGAEARRRQGQGADEGSRRHRAGQRRFHGAEGRRDRGRRRR